MELMKYETKIRLYNSYFDANERLTPKSILSIFQDVSSYHAEILGVGYKVLLEKNLYWVLSRIKYDIIKMPLINQEVIVQTWPHLKGRVDFDRDIRILSLDNEPLIIGTSKWCVIDTKSRMLQRANAIEYTGLYYNEMNYNDKFNKIIIPTNSDIKLFTHKVVFTDLDNNNHMNNTNYAVLISNAVKNNHFNHFEINFLNECMLNDEIIISSITSQENEIILGKVNNTIAFVAKIENAIVK